MTTPKPSRMTFTERLRASGLSLWELGDLLGIHPHHLSGHDGPGLTDRPVTVLIEIARRLNMHPADLVPELDSVLANQRRSPPDDEPSGDHPGDDAATILTALATASIPLTTDALADILNWPQRRAHAALQHATAHPGLGGPLRIQRIPPDAYTLKPRLDLLTTDQRHALTGAARHHATINPDEATFLLAAVAGSRGHGIEVDWDAVRADDRYQRAEAALKEAGLIYSDTGPHRVHVTNDVLFSLRYIRDDHIARERGETIPRDHLDPWPDSIDLNDDGTLASPTRH